VVIDIAVLGTVQTTVTDDQGVREVGLSYLERSLVATLACSPGRVVSVERIVDVLWDDAPPCGARTRVQGLVSSLRKRLGAAGCDAGTLVTDPSGYALCVEPRRIDAERFRALAEQAASHMEHAALERAAWAWQSALELWRGPAFDGLRSYVLQAEALRLEEMRMAVMEHRINADLRAGRYERVLPDLMKLNVLHPGRERMVGQLMIALHATDRHAEALGAYRTLQRYLSDQYGTKPGPRLRRMQELLLRVPVEASELLATLVDGRLPVG